MAAAAAAGSGTPREEETIGGEVAASQAQAPTSAPGGARLSRLPLARVKALVKADPDVTLAGQEAIFILARAAELFVETIAKDAYCCAQQGKRKTLQRRDLDNAIEAVDEFAFLEGSFNPVLFLHCEHKMRLFWKLVVVTLQLYFRVLWIDCGAG
ncbi:DNA polymerase epsilon subunit 4 isoform X2 [Mastomys coucha]|uniref:DNA polymerase epsilon subunit 4 isoform X2 n=1 Tax=Mastomys coucha TaxID=35658 RepID=UPI001261D1A9|nr:DNA polymerase epsilon subunit 4 isoform X2 [Mastomys coucha]